jgi:glycosyltransferase involved in cell wall biosynthesis
VLSDLPEWREFPEAAVRRIPVGGDEVEALAAALNELGMDEGVRASMEGEALRWAAEEAAWPVVADRTVELLERMPAHRTARRSLLQTLNKEAQRNVALRAEREKRG